MLAIPNILIFSEKMLSLSWSVQISLGFCPLPPHQSLCSRKCAKSCWSTLLQYVYPETRALENRFIIRNRRSKKNISGGQKNRLCIHPIICSSRLNVSVYKFRLLDMIPYKHFNKCKIELRLKSSILLDIFSTRNQRSWIMS